MGLDFKIKPIFHFISMFFELFISSGTTSSCDDLQTGLIHLRAYTPTLPLLHISRSNKDTPYNLMFELYLVTQASFMEN